MENFISCTVLLIVKLYFLESENFYFVLRETQVVIMIQNTEMLSCFSSVEKTTTVIHWPEKISV